MKELDIANFAESLVNTEVEKGKPVQFSAPQAPNAPDVSEVEVPEEFASQVLSEGLWDKAHVNVGEIKPVKKPRRKVIREQEEPKPVLNEVSVYKNYLIREYKKKVQDLEELIDLMESAGVMSGSIGAGPMGNAPAEDPMKETNPKRRKRRGTRRINTRG